MKYLMVALGLTIGNTIWALLDKDWKSAANREWFQMIAVLACAIA